MAVPVPVPAIASVIDDGVASLENVSVPLAAPVACGLKVTVNSALWPAAIVRGREMPLRAKRELLLLAEVTVTSPPVAARLAVAVPLVPTPTLPTFKVVGVTVNCAVCCDEAFAVGLLAMPEPPQPSVEARPAMTARKVKTATFRVGAIFMRKLSSLLDSSASESDVINPDFFVTSVCLARANAEQVS